MGFEQNKQQSASQHRRSHFAMARPISAMFAEIFFHRGFFQVSLAAYALTVCAAGCRSLAFDDRASQDAAGKIASQVEDFGLSSEKARILLIECSEGDDGFVMLPAYASSEDIETALGEFLEEKSISVLISISQDDRLCTAIVRIRNKRVVGMSKIDFRNTVDARVVYYQCDGGQCKLSLVRQRCQGVEQISIL